MSNFQGHESIDEFNRIFCLSDCWQHIRWLGIQILKYPTDLMVLQEIIFETKPDIFIETGTFNGGSAFFFASLFSLMGKGRVISIDKNQSPSRPKHALITYLTGSSADPAVLKVVKEMIPEQEKVMVCLDSDHHKEHVLKELELFHSLVSPNCYLVVEDTMLNGHPVYYPNRENSFEGPTEALAEFLPFHPEFFVDRSREKLLLTSNRGGYLRRNC